MHEEPRAMVILMRHCLALHLLLVIILHLDVLVIHIGFLLVRKLLPLKKIELVIPHLQVLS